MDVDSCQAVQSSMINAKDQLSQQATQMKTAIDNMVGSAFIAPSADQLKSEVETWNGKMTQLLDELQVLTDRLNKEIQEFIQTGGQLSG